MWLSIIILLVVCASVLADGTWVEDNFEDFRDGTFDAAGQNLYATRKGQIKTIHRFDLNRDGYHDLVFNSSHDFVTAPEATVFVHPDGRSTGQVTKLPVRGSRCGAAADLNNDGLLDLVICPNHNWATSRRYAFIFWGGQDGWKPQRMTNLVTIDPRAVAIADLDGDRWPEIIVLNGTRWAPEDGPEKVMRIYWGGEQGYRQQHYRDVILGNALDLVVEDLDSDGQSDIAILQYPLGGKGGNAHAEVMIYWNDQIQSDGDWPEAAHVDLQTGSISKLAIADINQDERPDMVVSGGVKELIGRDPTTGEETFQYSGLLYVTATDSRKWAAPQPISGPKAKSMALADLNHDGHPDAVLAQPGLTEDSVKILWGEAQKVFSEVPTALPIGGASAVGVADLDADGNMDLVVGVERSPDGKTYQSSSRIYYGDGLGGYTLAKLEIPTAQVNSIVIAPTDSGDGHRLVFCNNMSGRVHEDVPVYVYWGDRNGFSEQRLSKYHIRSGYCSNAADVNDDGFPDLILASIVHAVSDPHPERGFNILWGGPDGILDDRRTIVQEYGVTASNVADLDRDGYLDLIGSCNKSSEKGEPIRIVIWHGGPEGFDPSRRLALACPANGPNVVADFNTDGYLDIAVGSSLAHRITFLWGSPDGFSSERQDTIPFLSADDMSTADLNGDGYLDLIVTSYNVPGTLNYDYGSYIFWGSQAGFSPTNAQRLRTSSGCGISVADYDQDGHLDIHIPNYKWSEIRESIQSFLFWGSPEGYSDRNRTALLIDSGHATHSADFNSDGLIDLAISCHSLDGDHWVNSRVYYNDGNRFRTAKCQLLPTVGPHYMHRADVGNQYDRSYRQTYLSSVYRWDESYARGQLEYVAQEPGKSRLVFAVRMAASPKSLVDRPWSDLKEGGFSLMSDARCMQYRTTFLSDNGDRYPVLDRVAVTLSR